MEKRERDAVEQRGPEDERAHNRIHVREGFEQPGGGQPSEARRPPGPLRFGPAFAYGTERNDLVGRVEQQMRRWLVRVADRDDARVELGLGVGDGQRFEAGIGRAGTREAEERAVDRIGKAQRKEAAPVERGPGVGRGGVRREREHGRIGKILLDLAADLRPELPQHDPDLRVEHARAQCDRKVAFVVFREREDRAGVLDAGLEQRLIGIGVAGRHGRTGAQKGFAPFAAHRPDNADLRAAGGGEFETHAFGQRVVAHDENRRSRRVFSAHVPSRSLSSARGARRPSLRRRA